MNIDLFGNQPHPKKNKIRASEPTISLDRKCEDTSLQHVATIETRVKLKTNSVIQYDIYKKESKSLINPNATKNLLGQNGKESYYNGYLSPNTKRHIDEVLSVWLTGIEQNINLKAQSKEVNPNNIFPTFITLTLPCSQFHTDNTIKSAVLNPFIEWLKANETEKHSNGKLKGQQKGFGVKAFFWRAEPQGNTRIHFHIIVDKFVPWERIRAKWNQCCERLGYVTMYSLMQKDIFKNGFALNTLKMERDLKIVTQQAQEALKSRIIPEKMNALFKQYLEISLKHDHPLPKDVLEEIAIDIQKKAYEKGLSCDFRDPNTTDIHAIQNLDSITSYVIKYISKKPKTKPLEANQELVFNEAINKHCIQTFEKVLNPVTQLEEKNIIDEQFYEPTFLERKINGRIWGCSDTLRSYKPKNDDIIETDPFGRTFLIKKEPIENINSSIEAKIPVPIFKHFSKILYQKEVAMSVAKDKINFYTSDALNENIILREYIQELTKCCGLQKIQELSAKVGEYFVKNNGLIIPLMYENMKFSKKTNGKISKLNQTDVLKYFSPSLYAEYTSYHKHTFDCLYK
jgi:hypothetical protein